MRKRFVLALTLAACATLAWGAYIPAKAALAQLLLHKAWTQTRAAGGGAVKPWPWADMHPVARLRVPAHEVDLIALAGAGGNSLAFGPGHVAHSGVPGTRDTVVFGGHRDTHFRFLEHVRAGELIELHTPDGRVLSYRVEGAEVTDTRHTRLRLDAGSGLLALVTCWPFDAPLPGGTQRFVVSAREVSL